MTGLEIYLLQIKTKEALKKKAAPFETASSPHAGTLNLP
jgi:hypothetical protein